MGMQMTHATGAVYRIQHKGKSKQQQQQQQQQQKQQALQGGLFSHTTAFSHCLFLFISVTPTGETTVGFVLRRSVLVGECLQQQQQQRYFVQSIAQKATANNLQPPAPRLFASIAYSSPPLDNRSIDQSITNSNSSRFDHRQQQFSHR